MGASCTVGPALGESLAAPGAIGGTTPAAGTFTTLRATSTATFDGDLSLAKEVNHALAVAATTTSATAGANLAIAAAAGVTTGAGGNASLTAGAGGNDAVGGNASLIAGAAGGGNRAGGAAFLTAGAGAGSAAGGAVTITAGAAGATGTGGAANLIAGAGGATSGTGGLATVAGGPGSGGNANGGDVAITGGAPNGSGARGVITLTGRIAGSATGHVIPDPGNAGAISVTTSGVCNLTSAGAETRTLAIPTFVGQEIALSCDVDGGDNVITVASAFNQAGNTLITLNDAGDFVVLKGVHIAGTRRWRLVVNDGATLG